MAKFTKVDKALQKLRDAAIKEAFYEPDSEEGWLLEEASKETFEWRREYINKVCVDMKEYMEHILNRRVL
jgi:hypothetical protein